MYRAEVKILLPFNSSFYFTFEDRDANGPEEAMLILREKFNGITIFNTDKGAVVIQDDMIMGFMIENVFLDTTVLEKLTHPAL